MPSDPERAPAPSFLDLYKEASAQPDWPDKLRDLKGIRKRVTVGLLRSVRCPVLAWFRHAELAKRGLPPSMHELEARDYPGLPLVRFAADLYWIALIKPGMKPRGEGWSQLLTLDPGRPDDFKQWHSLVHGQYLALQESGASIAQALADAYRLTDTQSRQLFYTTDPVILGNRRAIDSATVADWKARLLADAKANPDRQGRYTPAKAAARRTLLLWIHKLAGERASTTARYWQLLHPEFKATRQAIDKQLASAAAVLGVGPAG